MILKDAVIFLDVDGVLNRFPPKEGDNRSWPPMGREYEVSAESLGWLPEPVSIIRDFVLIGNCKIVLSSTWRHYVTAEQVEAGLGVPANTVIGMTKSLMNGRGEEIEQWRKEFDHQGPFVIIDDDTYDILCCKDLVGHIVKTSTDVGLTRELVPAIKEALNI